MASLTGCLYMPVGRLPALDEAAASPPVPDRSLVLRTVFRNGGLRTQELVKPYSRLDVDHLVVTVTPTAGGGGIPILERDLSGPAILADIPIGGLRPDTTYRITGRAFARPGRDLADILSVDASSSIDLTVTRDDRPGPVALPVQLRDRIFDGQASTSVLILPGGVTDLGRERITSGPLVNLTLNMVSPRATQAVVRPWRLQDVDHVVVTPRIFVPGLGYRLLAPATGLPELRPDVPVVLLTIPASQLAERIPLVVGNLWHDQDYQLEAAAYDAVGNVLTQPDCLMNIRVERDDQVQLADRDMRLVFKPRPFSGTALIRLVRRDPLLTLARTEVSIRRLVNGSAPEQLETPFSVTTFPTSLRLNRLAPFANYVLEARGLDASGTVKATGRAVVNVLDDDDLGEVTLEL